MLASRLAASLVLVLASGFAVSGCICPVGDCKHYGDYFEAEAPGLAEAVAKHPNVRIRASSDGGEAPDWLDNVEYLERDSDAFVTVTIYHRPWFNDQARAAGNDIVSVTWPIEDSEAVARNTALWALSFGTYQLESFDAQWIPSCKGQCNAHLEFPSASMAPYLDEPLRGNAPTWVSEGAGTQWGKAGPWSFHFSYEERRVTVPVGEFDVNIESSTSGLSSFAVEWNDGRDVQVTHEQGVQAVRGAIQQFGLDPNGLREIGPHEILAPPTLRERAA